MAGDLNEVENSVGIGKMRADAERYTSERDLETQTIECRLKTLTEAVRDIRRQINGLAIYAVGAGLAAAISWDASHSVTAAAIYGAGSWLSLLSIFLHAFLKWLLSLHGF
jgi:hypothetical protein